MTSSEPTNPSLQVYYDGLCHLCSREINHYRKLPGSENINFIDITDVGFDPAKENLDPYAVHQVMHARTLDGKLYTKVDAFLQIWKLIPQYRWAIPIVQNPFLRPIFDTAYMTFAKWIRPYLPKKDKSCEASPYCETNQTKPK